MLVTLPANTHLYRVTGPSLAWPDVLAGKGAYFSSGGRYNGPGQQTVYASDDPLVVISEAAYYQAIQWQKAIGEGGPPPSPHVPRPSQYPLLSSHVLWSFTIHPVPTIVDVEDQGSVKLFHHLPAAITNPGSYYRATQALADAIFIQFGQPNTVGLRGPSVRTPVVGKYQPRQYVFRLGVNGLPGLPVNRWDLTIEFLERGGAPASSASPAIDWARPRFQLGGTAALPPCASRPKAPALAAGLWNPIVIRFD